MRFVLGLIVAIALLVVWPFVIDQRFILHIGVMTALFVTLSLSMNIMLRIGQLSMVHAAFMGLGAYGSALLMIRLAFPFWAAFLASGVIVALLAGLVGPIFLRIKGVYFVLLTFALSQVIIFNFIEWVDLFGGNNGLTGIPRPSIFGFVLRQPRDYYFFALALAVACFVLVRAIYRSEWGVIMDAINEDELLSRSLGVNAIAFRWTLFCLSGFLAGLSGSVYAHYLTFLSPDAFSFLTVVDVILMNVLGGMTSPIGPVIGAIMLVPLPEMLRNTAQYQVLAYGVLLLVLQLFLPDGIIGLMQRLRRVRPP
jgi:branched-chain amino acid transport system permease protein